VHALEQVGDGVVTHHHRASASSIPAKTESLAVHETGGARDFTTCKVATVTTEAMKNRIAT